MISVVVLMIEISHKESPFGIFTEGGSITLSLVSSSEGQHLDEQQEVLPPFLAHHPREPRSFIVRCGVAVLTRLFPLCELKMPSVRSHFSCKRKHGTNKASPKRSVLLQRHFEARSYLLSDASSATRISDVFFACVGCIEILFSTIEIVPVPSASSSYLLVVSASRACHWLTWAIHP